MEAGALARGAGGPDAAAVLADDAAADGEAEAGASHEAGVGGVDLLEALEDVLELVVRDAAAVVGDFESGFVLVGLAGAQADLAADGRELDGVRDEVGDGL